MTNQKDLKKPGKKHEMYSEALNMKPNVMNHTKKWGKEKVEGYNLACDDWEVYHKSELRRILNIIYTLLQKWKKLMNG